MQLKKFRSLAASLIPDITKDFTETFDMEETILSLPVVSLSKYWPFEQL